MKTAGPPLLLEAMLLLAGCEDPQSKVGSFFFFEILAGRPIVHIEGFTASSENHFYFTLHPVSLHSFKPRKATEIWTHLGTYLEPGQWLTMALRYKLI